MDDAGICFSNAIIILNVHLAYKSHIHDTYILYFKPLSQYTDV
jgi:hypothetical protein